MRGGELRRRTSEQSGRHPGDESFLTMLSVVVMLSSAVLTPLPAGLSGFSSIASRAGALNTIRRATAAAVGRALADGVELLEVEFPPLLEKKTQFDDFSNVEVLDANRDFCVQLALEPELRQISDDDAAAMWLCFADEGEAQLAQEAWPGAMYGEATNTYIAAAVKAVGREPLMPMGSSALSAASMLGSLFGGEKEPPPPPLPSPDAKLQLVVQPGDGGPMEDWLNLEVAAAPVRISPTARGRRCSRLPCCLACAPRCARSPLISSPRFDSPPNS